MIHLEQVTQKSLQTADKLTERRLDSKVRPHLPVLPLLSRQNIPALINLDCAALNHHHY